MKLICNLNNPPLGGIITAYYLKENKENLSIEWGEETIVTLDNNEQIKCETSNELCRLLARLSNIGQLYGSSILERTQIDSWLSFSIGQLNKRADFNDVLTFLNKTLAPLTYLVAKHLTIADFSIFAALFGSKQFEKLLKNGEVPTHILRWYNFISSMSFVREITNNLPTTYVKRRKNSLTDSMCHSIKPKSEKSKSDNKQNEKIIKNQEGKFVDLPGAEMGKVVVRFPPEASGYLHIGHAKAALLNQYYQQAFNGKLIMRFDDTNPAKENVHFEKVILEDVKLLEIQYDQFTHTSNYFDLMLKFCEQLLRDGKAYVDDTDPEVMKQEREQKIESKNRNNDLNKNLKMWEEMKKGSELGQKCCVRAKIDMQSANGCLRDPTIYRCKNELHPRTGDKYKVYPTYDFACPIVDAIEGVTHTLRTMEYHDRDQQFYWFIEALGLRKPYIWEYSRLSMMNTVLSKRKLAWFVEQGLVDGWDDPRMPTVRGILRHGMTVEGLKQFIIAQGSSRSVVFMDWDKIWAFNKKVIDPIAPRLTALDYNSIVPVYVDNQTNYEALTVSLHPKNSDIGTKSTWIGPKLFIENADAQELKEGENATFINWGNLRIKKINRENDKISSINAETNLDDKDFKKTLKLTWLCDTTDGCELDSTKKFTPCYCVYFDHLISKPVLGKDEDFKQYINKNTRIEVKMLGDPELRKLKQNDIIQLQRRGFFRVDVPYAQMNSLSFKEQPIILFSIPDGHTKQMATAGPSTQIQQKVSNEENKQSKQTSTNEILIKIKEQGDKIRDLKAGKADKKTIEPEVKILLELKAKYKELTGNEWSPNLTTVTTLKSTSNDQVSTNVTTQTNLNNVEQVLIKIKEQGDKIRDLKASKVDKKTIEAEVKILLELKAKYKELTGNDWSPNLAPCSANVTTQTNSNSEEQILIKIKEQGDKIRDLKASKVDKKTIEAEVKILLDLKADYKKLSGKDWTPNLVVLSANVTTQTHANKEAQLLHKIKEQGDKVRDLKTKKAEKKTIEMEVKNLLDLKLEFKTLTGKEWNPDMVTSLTNVTTQTHLKEENVTTQTNVFTTKDILGKIKEQGDKIRDLKASKADKKTIETEVKTLLSLKADYKTLTGTDWTPDLLVNLEIKKEIDTANVVKIECDSPLVKCKTERDVGMLLEKIRNQGDKVRELKTNKADKSIVSEEIKILIDLKDEYKNKTGENWTVELNKSVEDKKGHTTKTTGQQVKDKTKQQANKPKVESSKQTKPNEGVVHLTRLGLEAKKHENLPDWYSQVIVKGELIEYYDVSGCYIYRPWAYSIWERIKDWFDAEIKKIGVENCYFPIFVSRNVLEKEKAHISDFAPEVAWVTKSGDSDLAEPIAIRPTSETVMYPAYAKWIQSYRDLPIKLNQWNNVVRWEFKHPQPFLRTREFLWQEGHTAYASKEDADFEVTYILNLYAQIYTDLLAVPVVKGRKTEKEKFAGGNYTTTVEAFISVSGRGIQGATSHHLGQNFSRMFEITYNDPETNEKQFVYQNSWGLTTRTIGVMIMIHSDDQGLVLPPRIANIQVVIVPCGINVNMSETERENILTSCKNLETELKQANIRAHADLRENYSPGWKFNHWELKGVPIRVELGPKDIKNQQMVACRRDFGTKSFIKRENAVKDLKELLKTIQNSLFERAQKELDDHKVLCKDWNMFMTKLNEKNLILSPFCGQIPCEDNIKEDSSRKETVDSAAPAMGAKALCIPFEQPDEIQPDDKCIHPSCKAKPIYYTLFGRSY